MGFHSASLSTLSVVRHGTFLYVDDSMIVFLFTLLARFITLLANTGGGGRIDLRTLRAVRVLRPLKLVSGIPSTYYNTHSVSEENSVLGST